MSRGALLLVRMARVCVAFSTDYCPRGRDCPLLHGDPNAWSPTVEYRSISSDGFNLSSSAGSFSGTPTNSSWANYSQALWQQLDASMLHHPPQPGIFRQLEPASSDSSEQCSTSSSMRRPTEPPMASRCSGANDGSQPEPAAASGARTAAQPAACPTSSSVSGDPPRAVSWRTPAWPKTAGSGLPEFSNRLLGVPEFYCEAPHWLDPVPSSPRVSSPKVKPTRDAARRRSRFKAIRWKTMLKKNAESTLSAARALCRLDPAQVSYVERRLPSPEVSSPRVPSPPHVSPRKVHYADREMLDESEEEPVPPESSKLSL